MALNIKDAETDARIEIVAVDSAIANLVRDAFRGYGKRCHKAGLNFGDCIAYATAKLRDADPLAKGGDFWIRV